MFDCSDLHGRKVAHASRGLPENSGLQPQKGMYVVEVAPGLDVALVCICVCVWACWWGVVGCL